MLVGNKADEEAGKREVSEKTGQALQVKTVLLALFVLYNLDKYNIFKLYRLILLMYEKFCAFLCSSKCGNASTWKHLQRMEQMLRSCLRSY